MPNKDHGRCLVCGDISIGINFGVPTCMPCKAFFRRNAVKLGAHDFVCRQDGDCPVTYKQRRSCNCCRLAKCFRVGMKKSLILSDDKREARNALVAVNRLKRAGISKSPWRIWIQTSSILRMPSTSFNHLSSSDQVVLTNVFHAYENTCIVSKNNQLQLLYTNQHQSVHELMNEMSLLFQTSIEYFKLIPEFKKLSMDNKISLLKNHMGIILHLLEPQFVPVPSGNLLTTWNNLFGVNTSKLLLKRNQIVEQYIVDPIIIKVILIVLILSTGNGRNIDYQCMDLLFDDPISLLKSQNIYVDILWKYILSRTPNEAAAVKFFNRLMMFVLYAQNLHLYLDSHINTLKHEIIQMEPLMRSMWPTKNDVNQIYKLSTDQSNAH